MNTDQAYILGLVIGGGCFSLDHKKFHIRLPYRQWGEAQKNPEMAGLIATDILQVVKPLMFFQYNMNVSYVTGREWRIECYGDTSKLVDDLRKYGIEPSAELHKTADLSGIIGSLGDINLKKRFIAGVADTIGSMTPSHRRFSDDIQIISFEISGFNYKFVCQLCNLLYDVGCLPDQILWQHPNMQSGVDAYYTSWKKGNKLRVTLDAFSTFGSLAFKSKTKASKDNLKRQSVVRENESKYKAIKCEKKALSVPGVVAVHIDEAHQGIPAEIRGGHYIHHKQICAALNCEHAPCKELDELFLNAENYISPFAVLHKDSVDGIKEIIENDQLLSARKYTEYNLYISDIMEAVKEGSQVVVFHKGLVSFRDNREKGYPLSVLLDAVAYIISSKTGNLNGKRPRGNREEIIYNAISRKSDEFVTAFVPDLLTPMIVTDGIVSAMVGPLNAKVYRNLISFDDDNKYKMFIRKITDKDLR